MTVKASLYKKTLLFTAEVGIFIWVVS